MKRFKNYFLVTAVVLCMMIALCVLPVMAAEGETTTESNYVVKEETAVETYAPTVAETYAPIVAETGATIDTGVYEESDKNDCLVIRADDVTISNPSPDQIYSIDVYCEGASVSSFFMTFEMPYFTQISNVWLGETLANAENVVWEYNFDGQSVTVAYSSANEFADTTMFTVEFYMPSVTSYESGHMYAYNMQFVNTVPQEVWACESFGRITVEFDGEDILMGDADQNGIVNLEDVMYILRSRLKGYELEGMGRTAADIDGNGTIDMLDCQYIQNYLVGKLESLENVNGGNNGEVIDPIIPPVEEECKHENMYEVKRTDPTCVNSGVVTYQCDDCGTSIREKLPPTEKHDYVDGYCVSCGMPEENYGEDNGDVSEPDVSEPKHVYTYEDDSCYFDFYDDGTVVGKTYVDYDMDGIVDAYDMVGTWELIDDNQFVILHDKYSDDCVVFKVDENGDLHRQ